MMFVNLIIIFIILIDIVLGFFVYWKNKKSIINIVYGLLALAQGAWMFSVFIFRLAVFESTVLLWGEITYIFAALAALFFVYFALFFPKRNASLVYYKHFFLIIPFLILVYLITNTDLLIGGVKIIGEINGLINGSGYYIFGAYFYIYFGIAFWILIKKYLKSYGITREQLKYFILGTFITAFFATLINIVLFGLGYYQYNWLGPASSLIMTIFIAYAIVRYRLMDIRVIIKRSTVFAILVAVIAGLYTLFTVFLAGLFQDLAGTESAVATGFAMAVLVAIGFDPLKSWLSKVTDAWLFKGEYNPQDFLERLGASVSSTLKIEKILTDIIEMFDFAFHPTKQAIVVATNDSKHFSLGEAEGFKNADQLVLSLKANHPLISFFKKHREAVVAEEYERKYAHDEHRHKGMKNFLQEMGKKDVAVYLPLHSKDKLVGLLFLGHKKSGDVYTTKDVQVLDIASAQLAVAIENARLFEEMKDFNIRLQKEVEKATIALQHANFELKQLDQAKSEFISIASHQLRTPMTVIGGYASMLLEGSFGDVPDKERDPLTKIFNSNKRLVDLIETLLNISRIESGKLKYEFKKLDLVAMVDSVVEELKSNARDKNLQLAWKKPTAPMPLLMIDETKLRQVIINLIDNAIKYTPQGKVEVKVEKDKNKVIFKVVDTGRGMSNEEMVGLFQKFSRSKRTVGDHTGGSGLGLFVGRMMTEVHGGKIWAESKGIDQGSTFAFSLPIHPGKLPKLPKESKIVIDN